MKYRLIIDSYEYYNAEVHLNYSSEEWTDESNIWPLSI